MKKGCFYTAITLFTIIVIVVVYLYKTNKSIFSDFASDKIISASMNELNVMIDTTINSNYNDSLKILLKEYRANRKGLKFEAAMEDFSELVKNVKAAIKNKKIDSLQYVELKYFVKNYERSKKNRN